ncbi:MAG: hypothetical protein BWY83_02309 [bacterium ADurb.Bin478]|nr:MAG: hypothetical protein BWY83_02309 [bacterium ADurb.Bin478]
MDGEHPSQSSRIHQGLQHYGEGAEKNRTRDPGEKGQKNKKRKSVRSQHPGKEKRHPQQHVHGIDLDDVADFGLKNSQQRTAQQHADAPGDLHHAHLIGAAGKVVEGHQREQHADRHEEKIGHDHKDEQPQQTGVAVDLPQPLLHLLKQVGRRRRRGRVRIGNVNQQQRETADGGADDVEQKHVGHVQHTDQQRGQSRAGDGADGLDGLVDAGHAQEFGLGRQQRH